MKLLRQVQPVCVGVAHAFWMGWLARLVTHRMRCTEPSKMVVGQCDR